MQIYTFHCITYIMYIIFSCDAAAEGFVGLFEAGDLIGLKTEREGAGQFFEAKGDFDDAGQIETAAGASLNQLAGHLQYLWAVVLNITQRAK